MLEKWNWDTWAGKEENEEEYGDEEYYAEEEGYEPTCEDPDFIVRRFSFLMHNTNAALNYSSLYMGSALNHT